MNLIKIIITCFCFHFSLLIYGQSTYTVTTTPYNLDTLGVNADVPFMYGPQDDCFSSTIPIGFSFFFYGNYYDSLIVCTNGYLSFNKSLANTFPSWTTLTIPDASVRNVIMAPWHDLSFNLGGQIKYKLNGVAPFRKFVISYIDLPMYGCTSTLYSQQIILYESTNIIETHITDNPFCGLAVHGIVDYSGTDYCIVPGRNNTSWTTSNEGMRFEPNNSIFLNNFITGKVFVDLDADCYQDINEIGLANRAVYTNNIEFYTYTDSLGNYVLQTDTGNYDILHQQPAYYNQTCPSNGLYTINFPAAFDSSTGHNFALSPLVSCSDLNVDISIADMAPCTTTQQLQIYYRNNGTVADNNVICFFTLNDSIQLINTPPNLTSLGNNNYQIYIGNVNANQTGHQAIDVRIGCDTIGTIYCINAHIIGNLIDCDTSNNYSQECQSLKNTFSPNFLRVASQAYSQSGYVMQDNIDNDDFLTYLIHFKNTTIDTINSVRIVDLIPSQLDISTIQMGASSHNYNWFVLNGSLIIDFININLLDNYPNTIKSVGYVKFKIQQNQGNPIGTVIVNQVTCSFDKNTPVPTNHTYNTISINSGILANKIENISFMPNPVSNQLQLILPFEIIGNTSIQVFDVVGKNVQTQSINNKVESIDCSALSKGIYMARIMHNGSVYTQFKFVKE